MPNTEHDQYAEFFDVGHSGKDHTVHQRMRANSTIMEHKKILGAKATPPPPQNFLGEMCVSVQVDIWDNTSANYGVILSLSREQRRDP